MIYDVKQSTYTLTTGRRLYAHHGVIGINEQGDVSEGYDGSVEVTRAWDAEFRPWTKAERRELAEEMIRRWTAFIEA